MYRLTITQGSNRGSEVPLRGEAVVAGRGMSCALRLPDHGVSREHVRFRKEGEEWFAEDLGSQNGTRVNGQVLTGPARLKPGDRIQIGTVIVEFAAVRDSALIPAGATPSQADSLAAIRSVREARDKILAEVRKVIIGQRDVVESMLIALFSRGHCLVTGVPGLAKTLMVRTIASVLDLDFKRIQFTPDLMPSDITGTDILEEDPETHQRDYKFIPGPIFTHILLADEINRTPPKTQAALLEAMQEYRVTASGYTYDLKQPFFVLATQNPIEQEGTYPLPEAQLDRFMFSIHIGYPSRQEEIDIVKATTQDQAGVPEIVLSAEKILEVQRTVRKLPVSDYVVTYATALVRASRPKTAEGAACVQEHVSWGAGPRAAQCLVLGAKARAILDGRVNVSCGDVRSVAPIVLRHRIFTNFNADSEGVTPDDIIKKLMDAVPEPTEKDLAKKS